MAGWGKRIARVLLWATAAAAVAGTLWLYAPERPGPAAVEPAELAGRERSAVLDINTADIAALDELPGIGPVLAERIAASAPYAGPEELLEVQGIGPGIWADIAPFVYFGE